ncbi:MAG: ComEA family DNA-binding protein [Actinomycetota bacterium]
MDDPVRRPEPPRPLSDRAREWVEWFGLSRLITSAVAVVVVCLGTWWLVRSPTPPPEAALPRAAAAAPGDTTTTTSPATSSAAAGTATSDELVDAAGVGGGQDAHADARVVVHVAGAVERPGVYEFGPGSRIADAVDRAGGATRLGRPHELNLAAPLADGMRIHVPVEGEEVEPALRADAVAHRSEVNSDDGPAGPIDVNVATEPQLDDLPGVGPATAAAIVTERDRNGPFASVDDLERVPGIGPAKLAALRDLVTT